jgi:ubiquinone/menaquinone biosynthesis C-methylase UbiE
MINTMTKFEFTIMSIAFAVHDFFLPRAKILDEAKINPGDTILDYGCGTGSYSFIAAERAGDGGIIYALDIFPPAVKKVNDLSGKKGITNIKTINADCDTGLEKNIIDAVLFFDTFHMCENRESILKELHRVLKADGVLYFSDHHMKESEIISGITKSGLFSLLRKGRKLYAFVKAGKKATLRI